MVEPALNADPAAARPQSLRRLLLSHELALVALLALSGAVAASWAWLWQQSSTESIRLNYLAHTAAEIRAQLFRQVQGVSLAGMRGDAGAAELNSRYFSTIQELFNGLRRRSGDRAEGYAIQAMQSAYGILQRDLARAVGDPLAANRLVRARLLDPAFEREFVADFERAFEDLSGLVDQRLVAGQARLERRLAQARYAITVPLLLGFGLPFLTRRSLSSGFVAPLQAIMAGTRAIAAGRLDQALPEHGVAEVRELARGINGMARDLARSRAALGLHERQAALGALVPVVAHNVRNPLAAIRANAQLIEGSGSAEELREISHAIVDTADRLDRWVNALVSYLHPLEPRRRALAATALLDAAAGLLAPRAAALGVTIGRGRWDEEAFIEADPDLLEQALHGLVANAVEASPAGTTVTLSVRRLGEGVSLEIADLAGGIPFQPQASELAPGPTSKRFGTGLGLPIAFKICAAHGFSLDFDIRPGHGTVARVAAPLVDAPAPASP